MYKKCAKCAESLKLNILYVICETKVPTLHFTFNVVLQRSYLYDYFMKIHINIQTWNGHVILTLFSTLYNIYL